MTKTQITTPELLKIIVEEKTAYFEVALILNYGGRATHLIRFTGKHLLDEGIDGEERKISAKQFLSDYADGLWVIDQIVHPYH